jgi:Arc/MetJ-type ribon-helix-helix transcriptional regulator
MPKKPQSRLNGKKKLIAFTKEMETDIRMYCRTKAITNESDFIRAAVSYYLDNEFDDRTVMFENMKALEKKVQGLHDMLELSFRYLRFMHINLLAYLPEIDQDLSGAAIKSASKRHDKFFDTFRESLRSEPPFLERLLHTYFMEDEDDKG